MGYVNLAWVVLLYNSLSPKSNDILSELQVKFHSHGIGTTVFGVREYNPKKNGFYGQEPIDNAARIFSAKKRFANERQSRMHQKSHYVRIIVYNPILMIGEEVFSWTISHSSGLNFSNNTLSICEHEESQSQSCSNYTYIYNHYSPKKSMKGVTYYTKDKHDFSKGGNAGKKLLMLIREKLQFSLEYTPLMTIFEKPNSVYYFFPNLGLGKGTQTSIFRCETPFVLILRKPRRLDKYTALIKPFHWKVWIMMLVTFIISIPMLYGIAWLEGKIKNRNHPSMQDIFWLMIRAGIRQDTNLERFPGYKSKIAFLFCHYELFILTASYCGLVLSVLASPGYEWVPDTYEELDDAIREGIYTIGTRKGGFFHISNKLSLPLYDKFLFGVKFNHSEQFQKEKNLVDAFENGIQRALTQNYAFVPDPMFDPNFDFGPRKEELRLIPFGTTALGNCFTVVTNINSPYFLELKKTVQRIMEVGLNVKFLREDNATPNSNYSSDVNDILLIEDVKPALYILFVGTLSASTVFIIELTFFKLCKLIALI